MNSTSLLNIKHTSIILQKVHFHIFIYSPSFTNAHNHQAHSQVWDLSNVCNELQIRLYMHVVLVVITWYNCIIIVIIEYKVFWSSSLDINILLMNAWTYDSIMHTFTQQIVIINIITFYTCGHHQFCHHFACKNLSSLINHRR